MTTVHPSRIHRRRLALLGSWAIGILSAVGLTLHHPKVTWAQVEDDNSATTTPGAVCPGAFSSNGVQANPIDVETRIAFEDLVRTLPDLPSRYELRSDAELDEADTWYVVTDQSTCLDESTVPSLWWSRDQLPSRWLNADPMQGPLQIEGYRLIRSWVAYQSSHTGAYVVDIQVDPQYWNRLSPPQQYAIMLQLGTASMRHGYQTRIYRSIDLVGLYICDFTNIPELADKPGPAQPMEKFEDIRCAVEVGALFL